MGVQRIKNVNFLLLPLSTIAIAIELSSSTGRKHPDDADNACSMDDELSKIEFDAATTNPGALRRLMRKHGMMYNPLMIKGISPDRHFDWKRIHYLKVNTTKKNNKRNQNITSPEGLRMKIKSFAKLKIRVLTDRRMCFAGKLLRGIRMPRNRFYQIWIMKCFLSWYSSCIQIGDDEFKMKCRAWIFIMDSLPPSAC